MNLFRFRRPHLRLALPLLAVLLATAGPARGGADDFDFGRRLAQNRYFRQARKVFEQMLSDPAGSATTKDLARYGLATLGFEEAQAASRKADLSYADVVKLADAAALQIQEFADKNPKHPKAGEARILVGTVRVWIVTWSRELLDDPALLTARKATAADVQTAARTAVEQAEQQFAGLKQEPGHLGAIATYHWTVCQYWRALVFDPCSAQQLEALRKADKALYDYVGDNDGMLLGVYAQDILGQTYAEQAKCATNDEERLQLTNKAIQWFETCILTPNVDNDTLAVIANGYLHFGKACLAAKRIGTTNFLRTGVEMLEKMVGDVHLARNDTGIRAYIVYGDLQAALGNVDAAVKTYTDASDRAAVIGHQGLQAYVGVRLRDVVKQGSGVVSDIGVLLKVANSLAGEGKYEEAIPAFRRVIEVAPSTPQGFVDFAWRGWEQISLAYEELGDPLGAALALEGVYEAWKDGLIPGKKDDENDKNMVRAGNNRLRQESLLNTVARTLGSRPLQELAKRAKDTFPTDFPKHPSAGAKDYNRAVELYREAMEARKAGDPTWRTKMETARGAWDVIAKNSQSDKQDAGWARLVVIDMVLAGGADGAKAAERGLATIAEALAYWASAAGKKRLVDFPDYVTQRTDALVDVRYFKGELLKQLGRWAEVLAEMKAYGAEAGTAKHHDDASALVVEAAIELGDMDGADKLMEEHLRRFPKHPANPALVGKLAKKFDDQYRELTKRWNVVNVELNGTREDRGQGVTAKLKEATAEHNRLLHARVDLSNQVDTEVRRVAAWRKDPQLVKELNALIVKELEEKKIPGLKKRIEEIDRVAPDIKKKADELEARVKALEAELIKIVDEQYQPLVEAVTRYQKGWDSQYGEKPTTAEPKNTLEIATRWYFAAKNKRGTPEDWARARTMFEHYLGLDAVKALGEGDKEKRSAISKLGRVYSYLAETETDPAKRAEMVSRAVVMLESNVAQRPENNELVVGLLEGRYAVVRWENTTERDRPSYRFILPKTDTTAALNEAIQKLGTPESKVPLPVTGDATKQALYKKGLNDWRAWLAKHPDDLKAALADTRAGGMDVATYGELANTDMQFRLSLTSAYTESGNDADFTKCEAVLGTLLRGRLAPEDYTTEWWEATTITLRLWIGASERWAAQGGTVAAKASTYRKLAKSLVQGRLAFAQVPVEDGLRAEWKKLIDRLNKGLLSEKAPPLEVDLEKANLSGGDPAEPVPAAPAPGAVVPGGANPGDAAPGGANPGGGVKEPGAKEPGEPVPAPEPAPEPAPGQDPAPGGPK